MSAGGVEVIRQALGRAENVQGRDHAFGVADPLLEIERFRCGRHCGRRIVAGDGDLRDLREGDAQHVTVAGAAGVVDTGSGEAIRCGVTEIEQRAGQQHVAHRQSPRIVQLVEQGDRLTVGVQRAFVMTERPFCDGGGVEPVRRAGVVARATDLGGPIAGVTRRLEPTERRRQQRVAPQALGARRRRQLVDVHHAVRGARWPRSASR